MSSEFLCSIRNCPRPASETERAESEHWVVTIAYCYEHARELKQGVPLGPMGIDAARLLVEPKGTADVEEVTPHASFGAD